MNVVPSGIAETRNEASWASTPRAVRRQRFHVQSWSHAGGADAKPTKRGEFPLRTTNDVGSPSRPTRIVTCNVCAPVAFVAGSATVTPLFSLRMNHAPHSQPMTSFASLGVSAPSELTSMPKAISTAFDGVPVNSKVKDT